MTGKHMVLQCYVRGCANPRIGEQNQFCAGHWRRLRKHGMVSPDKPLQRPDVARATCAEDGCFNAHHAHGLCAMHYSRAKRAARHDAPVDVPHEPGPCPAGCGRPEHTRPALPSLALGLTSCSGWSNGK